MKRGGESKLGRSRDDNKRTGRGEGSRKGARKDTCATTNKCAIRAWEINIKDIIWIQTRK